MRGRKRALLERQIAEERPLRELAEAARREVTECGHTPTGEELVVALAARTDRPVLAIEQLTDIPASAEGFYVVREALARGHVLIGERTGRRRIRASGFDEGGAGYGTSLLEFG